MTFDLLNIKSPNFLKQLNINELEELCKEIRTFIIENVSKTGGHLSSNLGVVEATVALHYVFNSPTDKIIFDVGHQCYTHKILTGRAKEFANLRKRNGLSGFLSYSESEHDVWESGHSSTSLSAAAGFLEAKESNKEIGEVIAFIGDGAIQNGLAFEGLNYIGSQKNQKAIIILNDNDMSISRNVGRMALTLRKKRIKKSHATLRRITPKFVYNNCKSLRNTLKTFLYGNDIFTSLGYGYYGPIDGHDLKKLIKYFEYAKKRDSSVVIHLNTIKGKGYKYSEDDSNGFWHGTGPFDINTGKQINKLSDNVVPWGKAICSILLSLLEKNKLIKVINPAMIVGTFFEEIEEKFPNQIIDVGINEEHAVVMAAAMSRCDIIPIVSIYSTFLQRAYDEVLHDVCRSDNHVIFLLDHAGIVSSDGSTHQGVFDIPMLLSMPNMVIATPSNIDDARQLLDIAVEIKHPMAIRYPKDNINLNITSNGKIELGKWQILKPISDVNIITYGDVINDIYHKVNNIGLINAIFVKPIDIECLKLLSNKKIIVIEEVMLDASLYTMILRYNNELNLNIKICSYGVDEQFIECGSREEIKKDLNIDIDSILKKL